MFRWWQINISRGWAIIVHQLLLCSCFKIWFNMSPTYLFTIPESCKIIIENKRNSVIVRLPEKQYLKSVIVIIILTLLQRRLLNKEKSVVKLDYLKNYSFLFFRILLWFTVHPKGQMGIVSHDIFIVNYLGCYHLNFTKWFNFSKSFYVLSCFNLLKNFTNKCFKHPTFL